MSNSYPEDAFNIISNVYTIHILSVSSTINIPHVFAIEGNGKKMDSILLHSSGPSHNTVGKEYELIVEPIAKLCNITYSISALTNDLFIPDKFDMYVSIIIRNYKPFPDFNNKYEELNPEYNPYYIPDNSESDSE
jgi:hypothetical protein